MTALQKRERTPVCEGPLVSSVKSLRWVVVGRESLFDQLKIDLPEGHLLTRAPADTLKNHFGETDVALVELDATSHFFDFRAAAKAGLPVSFLLRSKTDGQFIGVCRFGLHKAVFKNLSAVGEWWELRAGRARPYEVFRKLLNRVSDGIAEVDANDRIRWVNTPLKQALPDIDWEGAHLEDVVKEDDQPRLRALRHQHSTGVVVPFAVHLPNEQQVELDPSPWFDEEGELMGTSLVFRRVRKTAEQSSRADELFCLYSLATSIGQATSVKGALSIAILRTVELLNLHGGGCFLRTQGKTLSEFEAPGDEIPAPVLDHFEQLLATFPKGKKALVERVLSPDHLLSKHGMNGYTVVPLDIGESRVGLLWLLSKEKGRFARETVSLVISIANQLSVIIENLLYADSRLAAELDKRKFYRDALCAVTRGKLVLCERDELDASWEAAGSDKGRVEISGNADVPRARKFVESALADQGLSEEKIGDAALCATEAVGNVTKHADSGSLAVRTNEQVVTIRIADQGPGIDFAHLPNAVLAAGYSTAPSLGMGYSILLELMDRVHLSTSGEGTLLLMEINKQEADPLDAFAHLLD